MSLEKNEDVAHATAAKVDALDFGGTCYYCNDWRTNVAEIFALHGLCRARFQRLASFVFRIEYVAPPASLWVVCDLTKVDALENFHSAIVSCNEELRLTFYPQVIWSI